MWNLGPLVFETIDACKARAAGVWLSFHSSAMDNK